MRNVAGVLLGYVVTNFGTPAARRLSLNACSLPSRGACHERSWRGSWCTQRQVSRPPQNREACIQEYVDAQSARKNGELLRAQQALALCADGCPGHGAARLHGAVDEAARAVPLLVLRARDIRDAISST